MIATQQRVYRYTANGATTVFAFPNRFFVNADIVVQTMDPATGITTTKAQGADYTVLGANNPAGGSITFLVAPANTLIVMVSTTVGNTQGVDYATDDNFPAETHEQALDRLTVLCQQLNEQTNRCIRLNYTDANISSLNLPARKNNVIGFDSAGNLAFYAVSAGVILPQSIQGTAGQILVNGTAGTPVSGAVVLTLAAGSSTTNQGTANQVLVNGTVGSPQSGATVFTLPQSIDTAALVQFGRLGIGTPPVTTSNVSINHTVPPSVAQPCVSIQGAFSAPAATSLFPNCVRCTSDYTATNAADAFAAYDTNTTFRGTVPLNHYYGFQARHSYLGTGVLDVMAGFAMASGIGAGTQVTEWRGLYIPTQSNGGGTVAHFAGIFMDDLGAIATIVDSIYCNNSQRWFSAGGQIITSALLAAPAGALNARGVFTYNQTAQTGMAVMNSNATATGRMIDFCNNGGTVQGSVTQTNSTTVAFNTTSDRRLKENFEVLEDVGDLIDNIIPYTYNWKWQSDKTQRYHGFIAQDVNHVYPEAVTPSDDQGDELEHPWQMDKSTMIPILWAEVRSLRARIKQLEAA